jgi:hypothetical protein
MHDDDVREDEAGGEPTPEERRYVEDLVARGEAAESDDEGNLPPGATHEIIGRRADGLPRIRRRRFSIN